MDAATHEIDAEDRSTIQNHLRTIESVYDYVDTDKLLEGKITELNAYGYGEVSTIADIPVQFNRRYAKATSLSEGDQVQFTLTHAGGDLQARELDHYDPNRSSSFESDSSVDDDIAEAAEVFVSLQARSKDYLDNSAVTSTQSPKTLAEAISIEAADLLECFHGQEETQVAVDDEIAMEVADVLINCLGLAAKLDIELTEPLEAKLTADQD